MTHNDLSANLAMHGGTVLTWTIATVEWINGHAGFFSAMGIMVTTGISIWGALKARDNRRGK